MKTAAVYIRVSTEKQAELNGGECQIEAIKRYLTYAELGEITVYEDPAMSGARMRRPAFDAMLQACREGTHGAVVAYSLSRLGRNVAGILEVCNELHELGVALHLVKEKLDLSTPFGRCMRTILAAVDELERERTSERTSDLINSRLARRMAWGRRGAVPLETLHDVCDEWEGMTADQRRRRVTALADLHGVQYQTVRRRVLRELERRERLGIKKPAPIGRGAGLTSSIEPGAAGGEQVPVSATIVHGSQ